MSSVVQFSLEGRKGRRTSLSRPASWTLAVDLAEKGEEEVKREEGESVSLRGRAGEREANREGGSARAKGWRREGRKEC